MANYALFSAMIHPLHSITNEEQYKKHLCNQSIVTMEILVTATGKPHRTIVNQNLVFSAERTGTQIKGGQMQVHDVCIVCTVVGEKAHLGMKRCQTVKKSSP